jgi:hypothetical protein
MNISLLHIFTRTFDITFDINVTGTFTGQWIDVIQRNIIGVPYYTPQFIPVDVEYIE